MRQQKKLLAGGALCAALASMVAGCAGAPTAASGSSSSTTHAAVQQVANTQAAGKPNVVFVLTDDLSKNLIKGLPEVQRMQKEGTSFSNYTVTDSLCCPSRSSIFTGRYPHNTHIFTNNKPDGGWNVFHNRGEEKNTFATTLQGAGYKTAMMGKYLNHYKLDTKVNGKDLYIPPGWNEWDVADNGYNEYNYTLNANGKREKHAHGPNDYLTDVVANKGSDFIRQQAKANNPFMLEIATFAPHGPYTPPDRYKNEKEPNLPGQKQNPAYNEKDLSDKPAWLRGHKSLTQDDYKSLNNIYKKRLRSVHAVNDMLVKLHKTLDETNQAKNTYVVFSSDNGYHLGDHRLMAGKQTAFETDVNVPLVVTGPNVPAGKSPQALASNIDLAPTFTDIGGTKQSPADGESLLPLLHGNSSGDFRQTQLVEHHGPSTAKDDPDVQTAASGKPPTYSALRTGTYTYVEYANGQHEYYDRTGKNGKYELDNTFDKLSAERKAQLHDKLAQMTKCDGAAQCTAASK